MILSIYFNKINKIHIPLIHPVKRVPETIRALQLFLEIFLCVFQRKFCRDLCYFLVLERARISSVHADSSQTMAAVRTRQAL